LFLGRFIYERGFAAFHNAKGRSEEGENEGESVREYERKKELTWSSYFILYTLVSPSPKAMVSRLLIFIS
jgi:hypothetical protein